MATTEILPFATDPGANVQSQVDYAGSDPQLTGFVNGVADPQVLNKVWRQSSFMAAALAEYLVAQGINVPDDGDLSTLADNIDVAVRASAIAAVGTALVYKGTLDCAANPNYPAAAQGDVYVVSVAGKVGGGSGVNVEVGDWVICRVTNGGGTQAAVGADFNIVQTNIDGAVTGPGSATSGNLPSFADTSGKVLQDSGKLAADVVIGPALAVSDNIATYNGTGGKTIQDSGKAFSTDGTLAGNSDALVPTQKAVKTYADTKIPGPGTVVSGDIVTFNGTTGLVVQDSGKSHSTDGTLAGNSDALIPTQKAVKTYADTKMSGAGVVVNNNLPTFSGTGGLTLQDSGKSMSTDGTFASNSDTLIPTQKAVKTYVDSNTTSSGATYSGVVAFGAINLTQNNTRYLTNCMGDAEITTEANAQYYSGYACTIANLTVKLSANVPASNSLVVTLRKNGVATTLTCTVAAGASTASDTTHSIDVGENDLISVEVVKSATFGTTNDVCVTFTSVVRGSNRGCGLGHAFNNLSNTANPPYNIAAGSNRGATEANFSIPVPAMIVDGIFLYNFSATGNPSLVIRKDSNTRSDAITSIAAPGYGKQRALAFVYNANDFYGLRDTGSSTGAAHVGTITFGRGSGYTGTFCPFFMSAVAQLQGTTTYAGGFGSGALHGTEANVQAPMPVACVLRNLRVGSDATPAGGQTITVTIRKNGIDTALTAQVTNGGGQVATDLVNSVSFAAGDLLSASIVTSGSVGTRSINIHVDIQPT